MPSNNTVPTWGLKRNVTPQFGARLVQEGNDCIFWPTVLTSAEFSATYSAMI